jgi:hypothetical protein
MLAAREIIHRNGDGRSVFRLAAYDPHKGWAKLPAQRLYRSGYIHAFSDFRLRRPGELNALKLYFLFAAFRDNQTNLASISYDKIEEYTAIDRSKIKGGLSVLATTGLVYVEHLPTADGHVSSAYRLPQLDSRVHMGTANRNATAEDITDRMAAPPPPSPVAPAERAAQIRSLFSQQRTSGRA